MIAHLKGSLILREGEKIIVSCGGVGYLVSISPRSTSSWSVGEEVEVFVHTYVKEDILALYGFAEIKQLRLFEMLIGVSGVGPKTGMNIMMAGDEGEIKEAIKNGVVDFFTKVPGIGKKNAQRLIVELRNKVGGDESDMRYLSEVSSELVSALENLGFAKKEIVRVSKEIDSKAALAEQIKQALKALSA